MSDFSQRHYEQIADVLNRCYSDVGPNRNDEYTLRGVENELIVLFKEDNARFDPCRFQARIHSATRGGPHATLKRLHKAMFHAEG